MSRVDVVIPCYNYARYLRGCVESVLSQQEVEVRILILDDRSPDNTPEVAAELVRQDDRVEFRRHEVNQGHIATYNEGLLEWASGDYTLLLSADDLLCPGALWRATCLIDRYSKVGMTYGLSVMSHDETDIGSFPWRADKCEARVICGCDLIEWSFREVSNPVPTPTAVVRTAAQQKVGGYNHLLPHAGDLEMWLRIAADADIGIINAPQAFYRRHRNNMAYSYHKSVLQDLPEYYRAFTSFLDQCRTMIPDVVGRRRAVAERVAKVAFWRGARAFEAGDSTSCNECLAFAAAIYPPIRGTKSWMRLSWKRRIGTRGWSIIESLLQRSRGVSVPADHSILDQQPRVIGWWPTSLATTS